MPLRGKRGDKNSNSQAIKDVEAQVKLARKKAKELLAKSGRDLRSVRSDVSKLKKAGLVSKRVDVRSYQPTRYMLSKIKKNADIISGEAVAVRAPKDVREKYRDKGIFETRGSAVIVPREYANQRTRVSRGMIEISRALGNGEERRLVLPFKATDMQDVAQKLRSDPSLEGMKKPDELFGFRLFGHNMATFGFPNAEELADYIETRYSHLFSGKQGRSAVKHFELVRFKSKGSMLEEGPSANKQYHPRYEKGTPKHDWIVSRRKERDAMRKKKEREKETPEERTKRLDAQRRRSAQNRQRKFLED